MFFHSASEQIKSHGVAIISLLLALFAVLYGTWRDEESEKNRTSRLAAFEALKHLGELQIIVNYTHFQPDNQLGNPFFGWGHLVIINDMAELLPQDVKISVQTLTDTWGQEWENLKTEESAVEKVSAEIDASRNNVIEMIRHLR
jgi:hypothetical protein